MKLFQRNFLNQYFSFSIVCFQLILCGLLLSVPSLSYAARPEINVNWFSELAIEGYDVVNYFVANKPRKGIPEFSYQYKGATWLFASQRHLDVFKNNPENYIPQYGGYCAYAVARNTIADVDPEAFVIHQARLYLIYNHTIREKWLADKDSYIREANKYWPGVLQPM